MANLSFADPIYDEAGPSYDLDILSEVHDHDHYQDVVCEHHEEHEIHDDVQPNYIVDSHANYTSDSNMILYEQALDFQITQLTEKVTVLQEQNELFRAKNAKIKQHYKELYDSIKVTRAKHLEQTNALTTKNENLKAQMQTKMKNVTKDHVKPTVLTLGKYAIDVEPIPPHNRNNREVHLDYLRHLKESKETLCEIVKEAKAEAVATACYTLNRSLVHTLHGKTYYELLKGKKPEVKYFRVFGSLCYPTNDYDDLGKLKAKADIGIFVGYAPTKKAYRIYNKRTHKIQETVHVTFDELTEGMTSVQPSTGLGPKSMAPRDNGVGPEINNLQSGQIDEEFPPDIHPYLVNVAPPRAPEIAPNPPSSTTVTKDAPVATTITSPSQTSPPGTEASSSDTFNVNPTQQNNPPIVHEQKWTKDHPLENVIGDLNRSVSIRCQLETDAMWCFFNEFLENVEPKNFKEAVQYPCWIDAMQEEIHEFERLAVWELVPAPSHSLVIGLKWVYKTKLDEYCKLISAPLSRQVEYMLLGVL
ncbi:integrase, catalytic region, zinc finger, CCHC-type containing protein [Tanacetum coccineum]|uniref:Integrase, catalytic region, zinc finger, CCHC-type containing protein n=1 Tax=Tanacetum coccineum TaxID=301880 RepID=A0ABQ5JAJ3_9ASTR